MAPINLFLLLLLLLLLPPSFEALQPTPPIISPYIKTIESMIRQACQNSSDPHSCVSDFQTECDRDAGRRDPAWVLGAAVKATIGEARRAIETVSSLTTLSNEIREQIAIRDCMELLDMSVEELGASMAELQRIQPGGAPRNARREENLKAWLSAALGNQDTCIEGFEATDGRIRNSITGSLRQVTRLVSNVLAEFKRVVTIRPSLPGNRTVASEFPTWIGEEERGLVRMDPGTMNVDAVVAQDGSGRYRTIMAAVEEAPDHGERRYVIYVKRGVYRENVELKKKKSNIMMVGEGMGLTVVSSGRNFLQGWTTFRTATFAVSGRGFIARDMTFRNTAGPENRQAVALRVDSDQSAFFRCSIEGYQDTLYAHSLRQFYRDCNIHGTVDFIFGNAAAVLQNCKIFTRKPLPYQKITITAQGRKDPNQATGFSIQKSFVYATVPTYLGRPWKPYSRTVFMQTYMSGLVRPEGWLEWAGNFGLNTLYYGEYTNYGPGAGTGGRVRWAGYHVIRDARVAAMFTVRRFIDGGSWLPSTGVIFTAGLTK